MTELDIALVILLTLFGLRGFLRGFFRESFGFLALVAGILAALQLTEGTAATLAGYIELDGTTRAVIAFVGIFLVTHTAVNLLGLLLDRVAHSLLFRSVNRVAGAAFGVGKGAVVLGFLLLFFQLFPMVPVLSQQVDDSRIARPLATVAGTVIRDYWQRDAGPGRSAQV